MKKISLLLFCLIVLSGTILARDVISLGCANPPTTSQGKMTGGDTREMRLSSSKMIAHEVSEFKAVKIASEKTKAKTHLKTSKKGISLSAVSGKYVMTCLSLTSSVGDGGGCIDVTDIEGTDSVKIDNFWSTGTSIKAKIDLANMKVIIPSQKAGTNETYGDYDIALCQSDGKPDRTAPIEGTINNDGTISIDTWWGMYVNEGSSKDAFFGAYYSTLIQAPNATMNVKTFEGATKSFGVVLNQDAKNVITVTNFANYGLTVEIALKRDSTALMESQAARAGGSNGDWMTCSVQYDSDGKLTNYSGNIIFDKAKDNKSLSWKDWTMLNTTAKSYLGILTEGEIVANNPIEYPALSVKEFDGEGTKESPYLIKTVDDMMLLSDKVNNVTEFTSTTNGNSYYARVYLGKYFKVTNDIDLSGYRFDPIGKDWSHIFAGDFDGSGHTISGVKVSTGAAGYAGLFGRTDTVSCLHNIILNAPNVESAGYYAGGLVAWSLGSVSDVVVKNAKVYNEGQCAGGVAGIVRDILNCSVSDSYVASQGGFVGGVAGEIDNLGTNCHAENMKLDAGGVTTSVPSGGVVGSAPRATLKNCYFVGVLNGRYASDLCIGGVAGVLYQGSMSNCFATGAIFGTGSAAKVGGVVGNLYGNVNDCYSTCNVTSVGSRSAGGIIGLVNNYVDNENNTIESSIKNCFTAGQLYAETYQYDTEKEVRETLGTISEGASPIVENVYFDKQVVDLTSKKYGTTTAQLTSAEGPAGFDASVWTYTEGQYPKVKAFSETDAAKLASATVFMPEGSNANMLTKNAVLNASDGVNFLIYKDGKGYSDGHYSSISADGKKLQLKTDFGNDTLIVLNNMGQRSLILKIAPIPFDGVGTAENPWLIKTKDDLVLLSQITTVKKQYFPESYFKMTNDIDLEYSTDFIGICTDASDAHNQFAGNFDGGGFTIHNMYMNGVAWKVNPEDSEDGFGTPLTSDSRSYLGFIGRLGVQGSLKNLNIAADAKLEYWAQSAALVGYCYGKIDNCKNYANVKGYSCWIGGITGQATVESEITNCYNAGDITSGYMQVGGIAGTTYGIIENCMNVGNISLRYVSSFSTTSKLNFAGGITGNANTARISNVVNAGTIYGYSKIGGITGSLSLVTSTSATRFNDMNNAINYGTVFSQLKELRGAISGVKGSKGEISDNYWDAQIITMPASENSKAAGMKGVETSVLTSGMALNNFSSDIWSFDAGMYPVLKQFKNEEKVELARVAIVDIPAGITAEDLSKDATLAQGKCVWSLSNGKLFTIKDNVLKSIAEVTSVVADTLICQNDGYIKPIMISRYPAIPLEGLGTLESPYLIKTTTDWNAAANYMITTGHLFDGEFVKIENDIDFTDASFTPLAGDGITSFQGVLLGNDKIINNIEYTATASYQGAIGIIGESATIKNLTIAGNISSAYTYTGGFAGKVYGNLVNCVNKVNVTTTKSYTGGLAGMIYSGATLADCVNEGTISSNQTYVAGITGSSETEVTYRNCGNVGDVAYTGTSGSAYVAGLLANTYSVSMYNCYNTGNVSVKTSTSSGTIAGLIANMRSNSTAAPYIINNCYNKADITGKAIVGGITAAVDNYSVVLADSCYNTGDIVAASTSTVSSSPTAGLFPFYNPGSVYSNCYNTGAVISQKNVYAAGVVGYYKASPTADKPVTIRNCKNYGDIFAYGNQGAGIVAYVCNYVMIDSCNNEGNIEGGFGLGGVIACLNGVNSTVTNCGNYGSVTTSTYRAGGIIGYNFSKSVVSDCYNIGNISTTSDIQGTTSTSGYGIGGIAGQGAAIFTNCYNIGTIKGMSQVGGLIGYPSKGSTQLHSCYNAGKIVAPTDTCGALIGVNLNNGKMWTEDNVIENSYYVSDFDTYANIAGTETTMAALAKMDMGEGWIDGDNYSLPILATSANNMDAVVGSAIVVVAEGDDYDSVTKDFFVGAPEGVKWTASIPNVAIDGNNVKFTDSAYVGKLILTASDANDKYIKTVELNVNKASDVDVNVASKKIVSETYYTISGMKVAKPEVKDGSVYVVVKVYDDGSKSVEKTVDK